MNLYKTVKIIVALLIIIIVVELGYYFYFQFNTSKNVRTDTAGKPEYIPVVTQRINPYQAYKNSWLNTLKEERVDLLVGSVFTHTYSGELVQKGGKGESESSKDPSHKFNYSLRLTIQGSKGSKKTFFYNENDLKKAKLIQLKDGKEEALEINDLATGNSLEIVETINALEQTDCSNHECLKGLIIKKIS